MEDALSLCVRDASTKGPAIEIKGNLIMDKCMIFEGDLIVHGSIIGAEGRWQDLKVKGDLMVLNGNVAVSLLDVAGSVMVGNINAWTVKCKNLVVNAIETEREITADNIHAFSVICNGLNLKEGGDLIAHVVVKHKELCEKRNWSNGNPRHAYIC